ncbi:MAG: type IV secretory system conjugative DNA transfer family protein [Defluviitaleaceae bacterium]|nr:type IV secretory system conjugative DNA transfer family protein [Defluviitaleaceae bacterium]
MALKVGLYALLFLISSTAVGYLMMLLAEFHLIRAIAGDVSALWQPRLFLDLDTYLFGMIAIVIGFFMYLVLKKPTVNTNKILGKSKKGGYMETNLENSRFMTDKERDYNFAPYLFTKLGQSDKDGIPVRAMYDKKKNELFCNLASPMHGLIIGATGSGKTTTFINPMVQILAAADAGSSMILTDPKGELFQMHSKKLQERGYTVMVLDLRDPYSSFRWNPLSSIFDQHDEYMKKGEGIFRRDDPPEESGLELPFPLDTYEEIWYEYEGQGFPTRGTLLDNVQMERQKIFDEMYEDLNDLVGVLCPIDSDDDPVWEKGARSVVMATLLAMLEDKEDPGLGMTKEKFNFYNLNKALSNSENNFEALKNYFRGRSVTSQAVTLSKQVLSAAENTLSSYMSITFDKLSMFNDQGLCGLTSATDIDPEMFADQRTALFMKIPDEKDTRHALASIFVLCIYKALIKKASSREDLSLPRNVYFILDEFGNMPKIDKFDKMITVGRSRKIWFHMVVQSYAQLGNVYGDSVSDIIKSNCGFKMFIGSNDIDTCEEFSKLCGNMTVSTASISRSTQDKGGDANVSTQLQTRPLIYPSDLQKLNNKADTGNAIIVTFGNYPIKTKFTPSYLCPLYDFATMDLTEVRKNMFFGEKVYYALEDRNNYVLSEEAPAESAEI